MRVPLVYHKRPIFGFDLGTRTAKMIQLSPGGRHRRVEGYGYASFPEGAIVEGIVVDPQEIAAAVAPLMQHMSFGSIAATRVAASLPVAKVFTRVLELPPMNQADLDEAVRLEAEQYIPVPLPDLYIDFEIIETTAEHYEVLMVAAPRAIVDSYIKLFDSMNLEVAFIEPSLTAATRAIVASARLDKPTLIVDIGSASTDLAVYDKVIRFTDTIGVGGDSFTDMLVKDLGIGRVQAGEIKYKFGIGETGLSLKVKHSLSPALDTIAAEMKRVIKFYQDRSKLNRKLEGVIIGGGSASMPGFVEYLRGQLGATVELADPWAGLDVGHLKSTTAYDASMYTTAIGLAQLEGVI